MIYKLGSINSNREGFESLAELWSLASLLEARSLELDLSSCASFDANMAASLGAVLALVADKLNRIEIVSVHGAIESSLRRNQFLTNYGYPALEAGATILPFKRFQVTDERLFGEYLRRYLPGKGFPRMTEGVGKVFQQSIFEVFQNAVTHSESKLGVFVCGQFFPNELQLNFTISDAGIGICDKVRAFLRNQQLTAEAAIQWALEGGNTTRTGSRPGGVGLKFLHDIVRRNRGNIQIVSGDGLYGATTGYDKLDSSLPGTTVNFEINTADTQSYQLDSSVTPEQIF
jgi:signal transduction histidine kinase